MQTETQATEVIDTAAQTVDTTAAATEAQASATDAAATGSDTSATTATEGDNDGTQQEQQRDEGGKFAKSGVQKRIDDLTFRRNQAEREAAHWKAVAQSRAPAAAPRPGDFDSDAEYDAAVSEHRIDSGVTRGMAKMAEAQAEKFSREASEVAGEAYNQRVQDTITRIPDFVDVVSKADVQISSELLEALRDSEKGPDLVYHLAKNPAEAERLNGMSVRQMDREIGRLELTIGAKAPAPAPAARTTNAPAPAKTGTAAAAPASTDPAKMDQAQFEAYLRANGSKYV